MIPKTLPHYVKMYRKINGLTQGDLSALLGNHNCNAISKVEHDNHIPKTDIAIGLAVIFETTMITLFPGVYEEAVHNVQKNAGEYLATLKKELTRPLSKHDQRRLQSLERIASGKNVIL